MMPLSCYCDYSPEPGDVCWYPPKDHSEYKRNRSTKCCSCGGRIERGDTIGRFERFKVPEYDIECSIYGEDGEIPRADWFMCETCIDLYFSLEDLGFCFYLGDNMHDLVKDYADIYGSKKVT